MPCAEFVNTQEAIKDTNNNAAKTVRHSVLDPLLEKLAHFNTSQDLSNKIHVLYEMLDADDNGTVSYQEMADGLQRLTHAGGLADHMAMTPEEFETLAAKPAGGSLLDAAGGLTAGNFEIIIRQHLQVYVQRQLALGSLWEEDKHAAFSSAQALMQGLQMLFLTHAADDGRVIGAASKGWGRQEPSRRDLPPGPPPTAGGC